MYEIPIVLVDDEEHILNSFSMLLERAGYRDVRTVSDPRDAQAAIAGCGSAVVVLDLFMQHLSGAELLSIIRREHPEMPVIIMTAVGDIETAVECMKKGAVDYLPKPVEENRFIASIKSACQINLLRAEVSVLRDCLLEGGLKHPEFFVHIVTRNKKMQAVFQYVEAIGRTSQTVLITGETGSGKELIARALHKASGLKGEFVAVNAAGLDDTMFADTIFGHERGAFTGADARREGMLAKASGGTLFLDEIGNLSETSQIKLLRLLEERLYFPLGSDLPRISSARIIAATNYDLKKSSEEGRFRKDLFYRLCSHHVRIPPLRERPEDIPLLVDHFLSEAAMDMDKTKPVPEQGLVEYISGYDYPGNVRELRGLIFDAMARHESGSLSTDSFRHAIGRDIVIQPAGLPQIRDRNALAELFGHYPTLQELDDYAVELALDISGRNQGAAAAMLGITRQALNSRLRRRTGKT